MNDGHTQRRNFLKTGIGLSLLAGMPRLNLFAKSPPAETLQLPPVMHAEVARLFGAQRADEIHRTKQLWLDAPDIAENYAVVPLNILGVNVTPSHRPCSWNRTRSRW